jgi:hypothetical protein
MDYLEQVLKEVREELDILSEDRKGEGMKAEEKFEKWFKSETWRKCPPKYAMEIKPAQKESYLEAHRSQQQKIDRLRDALGTALDYIELLDPNWKKQDELTKIWEEAL